MGHLTAADRGRIESLLTLQYSDAAIARKLGTHKTTIWRERQRGTNLVGDYSAEYAQSVYEQHRARCYNTPKLTKYSDLGGYVIDRIKSGWEPHQVAGRLKAIGASPRG